MSGTRTINGSYSSGVTLNTAYTTITGISTITSNGTAVFGSSSSSYTVGNAGYISGRNAGVYLTGAAGSVINSGTIKAQFAMGGADGGVVLAGGGSVTNVSTSATITDEAYGISIAGGTGTVVNGGLIEATSGAAVQLSDGGTISNLAGGTLQGEQWGVDVTGGAGTVLNAGSIDGDFNFGVALNLGGYVSNASDGRITGGHNGSPRNAVYVTGAPGTVVNNGFMASYNSRGVYFKDGGTVTNAGTISGVGDAILLKAGSVNRLIVDPGAVFSGTVDGGNTVGAAQASTLELASGASAGTLSGLGSKYIHFVQTTIDAGASWTFAGSNTLIAGYTLNNAGTVFDTGTLTNAGYLAGGNLVVGAGETFIDTGTVATTATIALSGGSGGIDLNASNFSGIIGNFSSGETISLTGVTNVTGYDVLNGNTLDITLSSGGPIDLTFDRDYTAGQFSVTTSGGNTVITTDEVTCFAAGTHMDTPHGAVAIEALTIGDLVLTATGQARPIRWIGRRHLDFTRHPKPNKVRPIRITAGALGHGLPRRDLLVSPDHALLLDGMLIPARLLLNGVTIRREEHWRSVTYYHIELDSHDVLSAEGTPAESYLDTGNRNTFENADAPLSLHPDLSHAQSRRVAASCAPFAADAARVEPVWQRLRQRASVLGLPTPEPIEVPSDPGLRVELAGRLFAPVAVEGARHIFLLPKWQGALQLRSSHAVPSVDRPWLDDHRQLGVKVMRMTLSGRAAIRTIPLDDPNLASGWWEVERDGGRMGRWTNGCAAVAIASDEPCRFVVELGGTMGCFAHRSAHRPSVQKSRPCMAAVA